MTFLKDIGYIMVLVVLALIGWYCGGKAYDAVYGGEE